MAAPILQTQAPLYAGDGVSGDTPIAQPALAVPAGPTPTGKTVNVISPTDGKVYGLDAAYLQQASQQGYQVETAEHAGIRSYLEENQGIGGAAKVALQGLLNEGTFGVAGVLAEKTGDPDEWSPAARVALGYGTLGLSEAYRYAYGGLSGDPYKLAKFQALQNEHEVAGAVGSVGGFGLSMLYGGPVFKGAAAAGKVARAGVLAERALAKGVAAEAAYRVGAEAGAEVAKHSPGIARQIMAHAADYGAQGAVFAAPKAAAQLFTGDPDRAAETFIWGVAGGAALGGAVGGVAGLMGRGVAARALPAAAEVAAVEATGGFREKVASKLREIGDEQATSALDLSKATAKKLRRAKAFGDANKIVREEGLAELAGDFEATAGRISELHNEAGARIGALKRAAGDSPVASLGDVASVMAKPIMEAETGMGSRGAAQSVKGWLNTEVLVPLEERFSAAGSDKLTLGDLHDIRKVIDAGTKWDRMAPDAVNILKKDVRASINELLEAKIKEAGEGMDRALLPEWKQANRRYQVLTILKENAANNVERGVSNRKHSLTDYLGNQLGATVGGFVGGAPGAAVGGLVGGEVNNFLRRKAPALLSRGAYAAAEAVEGRGLAALEGAFAKHDTQLATIPSLIERMSSGASRGPARETLGVNILSRFLDVDDHKHDSAGLMKFADRVAELAANPDRMQAKVEEAIAPLGGEAPEVGMAIAAKLPQVAQYLAAQAPKSPYAIPTPFSPVPKWKPSDAQLKDYKTKVQVALDPYAALDALGNGTLTKAHVDALREVAPKLYEEMIKRITDYGSTGKAPALPYAQRLKLSIMTGAPLDRSLANLAGLQSIYRTKDAAKKEGGGTLTKAPQLQQTDIARVSG